MAKQEANASSQADDTVQRPIEGAENTEAKQETAETAPEDNVEGSEPEQEVQPPADNNEPVITVTGTEETTIPEIPSAEPVDDSDKTQELQAEAKRLMAQHNTRRIWYAVESDYWFIREDYAKAYAKEKKVSLKVFE
jgi:hypothetical protein